MTLQSLFNGEAIPQPPRRYVHGIDRRRPSDDAQWDAFERAVVTLARLCDVRGTPFTGRFRAPRIWQ